MVSSNVAGYTKKRVTSALLFTGYCIGNIIGPQTLKDSEAPGYHSAYIAMPGSHDDEDSIENGMLDQKEIDNIGFRYVL
ncbi:MFS general substrate transporter [Penicillium cinerascens]|uniref:MFS general substrate transporter n=1 Tax=Penicillium cinerascens TaxID=70096 RepID=A0A9W9JFU9_9EURO|nr:MFS general substrate transporter [Penicillium cinerascens]KAJ5195207.1 MFS general substrate transporter [Penicillium cinerascens]